MFSTLKVHTLADTCPKCGRGKCCTVERAAVAASQPWAKSRSSGVAVRPKAPCAPKSNAPRSDRTQKYGT